MSSRMRLLPVLLVAVAALLIGMNSALAEYIILKDGKQVDGQVIRFDENGILFERSNDSRRAWLEWSQLDSHFAEELKSKLFTKPRDIEKEPEQGTVPGIKWSVT